MVFRFFFFCNISFYFNKKTTTKWKIIKKKKKYETRRFFIYCHLFIGIAALLTDMASGFKLSLMGYHTLNFEENFVRKKFYYIDDESYSTKSTGYYLYGIMENDLPNDFEDPFAVNIELRDERRKELKKKHKDIIKIFVTGNRYGQFFEEDEKGRTYITVWYNPKLEKVYSINYTGVETDFFYFYFLFIIWIIPEIWYLRILRKREKRALLQSEKTST